MRVICCDNKQKNIPVVFEVVEFGFTKDVFRDYARDSYFTGLFFLATKIFSVTS